MLDVERCPRCGPPMSGPVDEMIVVGSKASDYRTRKRYMICPHCGYREGSK